MEILNNSLLNILIPNDNKALKELLKEADTKTIEQLLNNKSTSIGEILKNLFDDLKSGEKSNSNIENILKNSTIFKELGNFSSNISTLINLLKQLPQSENILQHIQKLSNFNEKIENLSSENLKEQIKNSGVFLESKILNSLNNPSENKNLNFDLKTILLKLNDELSNENKFQEISKQIDKLLSTIEFNQLNSIVSNSNYIYIPFFWEMLEEGFINFKKIDEEKFFCQINLDLKDIGKVDLMLALYDKNKVDLTIHIQNNDFKELIKNNLQKLKTNFNSVDLIAVNIRVLDLQKAQNDLKDEENQFFTQENFNIGINIRA